MQIIRESFALSHALAVFCGNDESVAFVPTMGALHAGHLALVERARELADRTAVSIFINPLQFNNGEDLRRYPRQEDKDIAMLEASGCDLLWMPEAADLYPEGFATTVSVAGISERWEGEHRRGHFDGVATVVTKLLHEVMPDVALFGEKDFQQLAVIRRLVRDLDLCPEIVGVATVREADGLALSSRNALLSSEERARAVALPRALETARSAILGGTAVPQVLSEALDSLSTAGFSAIDYFALVDAATLEPIEFPAGEMRLIAAAAIGSTRLIDNIAV